MLRSEIETFFKRRDEAWNRHDVDALTDDHAEDGQVQSPLWGDVEGHAAIRNIYASWFASFPDAHLTTEHLLIDGDRAAQFAKMSGVQKGTFCGLEPTGKRFEARCSFLFRFSENKIACETRIYDFTGILLQLGVLKAKPAF